MNRVWQKNKHDPANGVFGDCQRACIASMLDLRLEEVPHFADGWPSSDVFAKRLNDFLRLFDMVGIHIAYIGELDRVMDCIALNNPGVYYTLSGSSSRGFDHCTIALGSEIVHDPAVNPGNAHSIVGPCADGLY